MKLRNSVELARDRARRNLEERRRSEGAYGALVRLWRGMEAATEGVEDFGEPRLVALLGRAEEMIEECRACERRLGELLDFLRLEGRELEKILGEEAG